MSRELNNAFIKNLLKGDLKELLGYIKWDNTLDLQIRENYINIYYQGGNILKVSESKGKYVFTFDYNYLRTCSFIKKTALEGYQNDNDWNAFFPLAKQAMDFYFSKMRKEEREFQQLVVRENNYSSIANSTDYFIIDIEYNNRDGARFDIIALQWDSTPTARQLQKGYKPKLVIFEMKYGDEALNGSSGMGKHCSDFKTFTSKSATVSAFKHEMLELFEQKRTLGLIPSLMKIGAKGNSNPIVEFVEQIEFIFLIANHDPESSKLQTELTGVVDPQVKFITSNFMGYGLYTQNVFTLDQFLTRFQRQICQNSKVLEKEL